MNHNTITEPYWVEGKGWASVRPDLTYEFNGLRVQTLQEGDIVYQTPDGHSLSPLKITTIRVSSEAVRTYNLYEIEATHTYFANRILVHNKNSSGSSGGSDSSGGSTSGLIPTFGTLDFWPG